MQFVNVREFKIHATRYLNAQEEVVITKYGKPIARLVPETEESISDLIVAMGQVLKEAGVTKKQALAALERARSKVYGRSKKGSS
jgi:prevent-host-death family protein